MYIVVPSAVFQISEVTCAAKSLNIHLMSISSKASLSASTSLMPLLVVRLFTSSHFHSQVWYPGPVHVGVWTKPSPRYSSRLATRSMKALQSAASGSTVSLYAQLTPQEWLI